MLKLLLKVQHAARHGAEDVADVAELSRDGAQHVGEGVGVVGALVESFVAAGEFFYVFLFVAEDLDHLLAFHHLLNKAVQAADILLLRDEISAGNTSELAGGDGDHAHHHQGQDGQRNVQVGDSQRNA